MSQPYNPVMKELILEVVDNQIEANDPPITRQTMTRLTNEGYTQQQAKEMIGAVVVECIYYIQRDGKKFDLAWFEKKLKQLGD